MQEYYKFINEPLPYSYKAMEPFIDIQTMYLHHDAQGLSVFADFYVRTASMQFREYAGGNPYTD